MYMHADTHTHSPLPYYPHSAVLLWKHEWDVLKTSYNVSKEVRLWRSALPEGEEEEEEEGEKTALFSDPGRMGDGVGVVRIGS